MTSAASRVVFVDVFAHPGAQSGEIRFCHEWRLQGDPHANRGDVRVPTGAGNTPIVFQLHDHTTQNVNFRRNGQNDAPMWVSQVSCPTTACSDGQFPAQQMQSQPRVLTVMDLNTQPGTFHYALRFTSSAGDQLYDPIIING